MKRSKHFNLKIRISNTWIDDKIDDTMTYTFIIKVEIIDIIEKCWSRFKNQMFILLITSHIMISINSKKQRKNYIWYFLGINGLH
jgi:hypothetical protein